MSEHYKKAGVSLENGYASIERIKKHIAATKSPGFSGDIGGFGGLFDLYRYGYREPVLVSGTDGVGTKLLLAIQHQRFNTIGIDLVAMCVNDIITVGAQPLFFLDYIAVDKNRPQQIEEIVSGIAHGCMMGSLSLIGGETAEMPGMYAPDHFDLAGFAVGVVEKDERITGETARCGDVLIGIPSSGIHSNGYSLVRSIISESKMDVHQSFEEATLLDVLLEPTRIYVSVIQELKQKVSIHAMCHITGGGLYENLPRMLGKQDDLGIDLDLHRVQVPRIFTLLMEKGNMTRDEMYEVFNMGIGFVVAVGADEQEQALQILKKRYTDACIIGKLSDWKGMRIV
jgi:phosphoribosylformylglycinamidine cyclo-ligase